MTVKTSFHTRQLCFFLAFLLPVSKIAELPSLLAYYAKDDLLLPAILQFLLQAGMLALLILFASKTDESMFAFVKNRLSGRAAKTLYFLFAAYFVFSSILPLLNLERFVYTAFFDTAPGVSAFAPFFLLAAYIASKNLKCFARICDLCMPLFILSFVGLIVLSLGETDFTALMPALSASPRSVGLGVLRSLPHFSDTALLVPLLGEYRHRKGDGKKLMLSYALGAAFVLLFLAVFYGIFGALAPQQAFAFDKIAGYFGGLAVVGRIDLLLVYLMTVVVLFYRCFPLLLAVHCFSTAAKIQNRIPVAAALSVTLLVLTVFFNRFYGALYSFVSTAAVWVFPLFAYGLPLLCLGLLLAERGKKCGRRNKEDGYA